MEKQAQAIYKHFGYEHQQFVAREEYHELQVALNELGKHDIKIKRGCFEKDNSIDTTLKRLELEKNCNEELADNVLVYMQITDCDFQEAYAELLDLYIDTIFSLRIENFRFDKELVKKIVQEKIDRTIKKYGIGEYE